MAEESLKVQESAPLLNDEAVLYKGEMEPEEKEGERAVAVAPVMDGIPYQRTVPVAAQDSWSTGLFDCCYNSTEQHGQDCEICMLGWVAPCILYGSTRERLGADEFSPSCCLYNGLWFLSQALFNANCFAPLISFKTRTEIRHRFNLEGQVPEEGCGCYRTPEQRESLEQKLDCLTHFVCHPCALCQEAREVRRRVPHPAPVLAPVSTKPPAVQVMGMKK